MSDISEDEGPQSQRVGNEPLLTETQTNTAQNALYPQT